MPKFPLDSVFFRVQFYVNFVSKLTMYYADFLSFNLSIFINKMLEGQKVFCSHYSSLKSTIQERLYSTIISITVKNLSEKIQSQFPDTKKVPAQNTLYTQYVL